MEIFKQIESNEIFEVWNNCRNMWLYYSACSANIVFEKVKIHIKGNQNLIKKEFENGMIVYFCDNRSKTWVKEYVEKGELPVNIPWVQLTGDSGKGMKKSLWISFEESCDNEERQIFSKWFADEFMPVHIVIEP